MAKKKIKKTVKTDVEAKLKQKESAEEGQKVFDYGGLPDRDLKKNLGCG